MNGSDYFKSSLMIAMSACVAILLTQNAGVLFYIGILGGLFLVLAAVASPWHGLLALFPLVFALRPAPPSVGTQELIFAALTATVFVSTFIRLLRIRSIKSIFRFFAWPLLIGIGLLCLNLLIAMKHHVPVQDWIRGVTPFLFIFALMPVCVLINGEQKNIYWIGASIGALVLLSAGHIVLYYFQYDIWQPYWTVLVDGEQIRLSREAALNMANTVGPLRDRITMLLPQATDALLPSGMAAGFVINTLTRNRYIALVTAFISLLCLTAVLITLTRSMLISGVATIALFSIYIFVTHKNLRVKISANITAQLVLGLVFIFSTGMDQSWLGRLNSLSDAALPMATAPISSNTPENTEIIVLNTITKKKEDFNVASRVKEYEIAWDMFLSSPVFGNGIGVKHEMHWEKPDGSSLIELVGYIHNWPLYMLMVSGVLGLLTYTLIIMGPALYKLTTLKSEPNYLTVIRITVMTMAIYGLFFAVFRLISFNILLATAWGLIYAQKWPMQKISDSAKNTELNTPQCSATEYAIKNKVTDQQNREQPV